MPRFSGIHQTAATSRKPLIFALQLVSSAFS